MDADGAFGLSGLRGARVVLGVTGGIAAYKAVEICRRLIDLGAHVSPVMTEGAKRFVGETTFSALASEPVKTSLFGGADPIPHTTLGQTADVVVVAPATARFIASYRLGMSDGLLIATLLATRAPVVIAPAMHTEMWEHASVVENLAVLAERGVHIVAPEDGRLAGGDVGSGRLAQPATIVAAVAQALGDQKPGHQNRGDMHGLDVLITAGGTREPIDPVRFIGNRSSGKQGYALAAEAASRGATVTIVSTVDRDVPEGATVVRVDTADEMHRAVMQRSGSADIVIMSAAVADFRPVDVPPDKIKKGGGVPQVTLEPTVDILAALGSGKPDKQTLVGFAAETTSVRQNAQSKLKAKGADIIVANDVSAPGVGFEHDTNEVFVVTDDGVTEIAKSAKREIARAVLDAVIALRSES